MEVDLHRLLGEAAARADGHRREGQGAVAVEVVFETHSVSLDNERGIATGWLGGALSTRGRELASELGRRRREDGLAAVFTSDLARAVETARIAFAGTSIPIHEDARLRECNYGSLNGSPTAALAPRARFIETPFPGGESYRDVVTRVARFLAELAPYEGKRLLVIGHSATRWALEHLLNGVALEDLVDAPFAWQPGWEFRA
jgi:broad specificity phosphatase PhoE